MFQLIVSKLSPLQLDVLIHALESYAMHAKQNAVYCDSIDQPLLKRMWLARAYAATDMRKGV